MDTLSSDRWHYLLLRGARRFPGLHVAASVLIFILLIFNARSAENAGVVLVRVPNGGIQPQAVKDRQGVIHLIYFQGEPAGGDAYYVRRSPGSAEFSRPVRINSVPNSVSAFGTIRGAQLALGKGGRIHVVWNGHPPAGKDYMQAPMLYTRSNDAGTGFEPERNLITSAWGLDGGGSVTADGGGNVYVMWHAPRPGSSEEANGTVFLAKSTDEGKTFNSEKAAISQRTGACGCCGMKSFADEQGNVLAFFRSASEMVNRNETLLLSHDRGATFDIAYSHSWKIGTCPMSSAFLSEDNGAVLAAEETHERVYFVRVDPKSGTISNPTSPDEKAKYPVVIANARGNILLVWVTNTSWGTGGALAWQVFDKDGNALSGKQHASGVPAWSMAAAVAGPDNRFTIFY